MEVIDGVIVVNLGYEITLNYDKIGDPTYLVYPYNNIYTEEYEYAWYIYKDEERVATIWYSNEPYLEYKFNEKVVTELELL